jgi:hypothetical protein
MRIATIKTSQGICLGLKTNTGAVRSLLQEEARWPGGLLER